MRGSPPGALLLSLACLWFAGVLVAGSSQPVNSDRISELLESDQRQYLERSDLFKIYPKYGQANGTSSSSAPSEEDVKTSLRRILAARLRKRPTAARKALEQKSQYELLREPAAE